MGFKGRFVGIQANNISIAVTIFALLKGVLKSKRMLNMEIQRKAKKRIQSCSKDFNKEYNTS